MKQDDGGLSAAARVIAAGGRVPRKFARARPLSAGPTLGVTQASAKITPARRVAFEILTLVGKGKGHSDELLHGVRTQDLSEPDSHLATALVMGVLRWQIALDARIRRHLQKPDQPLSEPAAISLRLGAFQLLHMDRIPAHAALSESVEMCRAAGEPHAAGMVNAVLRKIARPESEKELSRAPIWETTAAFAERLGHPQWLVERWVAQYGRAFALAICKADQQEPAPGGLFTPDQRLPQIDDGSRLVAELAAAILPPATGPGPARVWDCCAAPGGKTLVLAARLQGADILATDASAKRTAPMQRRLRQIPGVKTEVVDATNPPENYRDFDLILCDVPCSGTGTLSRNPEIRSHLRPEDLLRQAARQKAILAQALTRLRVGGRLLYSTCSLEPEENEHVVHSVEPGFARVSITALVENLPGFVGSRNLSTQNGAVRTLPGVDPCDGFYAAVLERV